jgi:hypothetical protein
MKFELPKVNLTVIVIGIVVLAFAAPIVSTLAYCIFSIITLLIKLIFSSVQIAAVVFGLMFINKIAKRYRSNEGDDDGEKDDDE